jgi:hypothetical protein
MTKRNAESTTIKYVRATTKFQEKWEGNNVDMMELFMTLDASEAILQARFNRKPSMEQIIEFSKVVAKQQYGTEIKNPV